MGLSANLLCDKVSRSTKFVFKGNYMGSRLRFFLGLFTKLLYFSSFLLSFSKQSNENKSLAISIFQNYSEGPALKCTAAWDWLLFNARWMIWGQEQPWILWVPTAIGFAGDCDFIVSGDISHYCFLFFFFPSKSFLILPNSNFRPAIIILETFNTANTEDFPDSSVK